MVTSPITLAVISARLPAHATASPAYQDHPPAEGFSCGRNHVSCCPQEPAGCILLRHKPHHGIYPPLPTILSHKGGDWHRFYLKEASMSGKIPTFVPNNIHSHDNSHHTDSPSMGRYSPQPPPGRAFDTLCPTSRPLCPARDVGHGVLDITRRCG